MPVRSGVVWAEFVKDESAKEADGQGWRGFSKANGEPDESATKTEYLYSTEKDAILAVLEKGRKLGEVVWRDA